MNAVHEARENGRINISVSALDTRLSWPQITVEEVQCRSTSRYNEQEQKIWICGYLVHSILLVFLRSSNLGAERSDSE
jgi:hypothetical protein